MNESMQDNLPINRPIHLLISLALTVVLIGAIYGAQGRTTLAKGSTPTSTQNKQEPEYNPTINPADFTTKITNKYFSLPVGKEMTYQAETEDGPEKIVIRILPETRTIMGVTTVVYLDTVYLNGQLHEITKDYLAQHKTTGDVWYFGEEVDNYENGKLKDHAGSFIHGNDGARAGIWMKAEQKIGDSYRQEYYKSEAEDMRDVISLNETVTTKLATYTGCVKVYDWTPLDPKSKEHKYYCPEVGALVLIEHLVTGKNAELTNIAFGRSEAGNPGTENAPGMPSTGQPAGPIVWSLALALCLVLSGLGFRLYLTRSK
ncbi:MAG: hypothetical protein ABIO92_02990 [Chloroflexia bacterium]